MAHAMAMRATSFVASATVIGLLALGALTMTIVQRNAPDIFSGNPFQTFVEPPAAEPVKERDPAPPPAAEVNEGQIQLSSSVDDLPLMPTTIAASAGADTSSAGPPNIANPHWVRVPRGLDRYYPRRALERGVEGAVTLNCVVATSGRLNCAVVSETPVNWGFGDAALSISRDYQMVPATRDGVPVEGRHRMVIPFRLQ